MKVELRLHGTDVEHRYQSLVAMGMQPSVASENASSIEVEWPDGLRLPVGGDHIDIDGVMGTVRYVRIQKDGSEWSAMVKLLEQG
jgi:hypothetical protein